MNENLYDKIAQKSIAGEKISAEILKRILISPDIKLLPLLNAAFEVRKKFCGNSVKIHIIDNVQNGLCSEDCSYCAQSKTSKATIQEYPMKTKDEILAEAKDAYESGAFRHCLVFSGKGQSDQRIEQLVDIIKEIKRRFNMQVCVSPGVIDDEAAKTLKAAGLDRLNHNINTSEKFYSNICSSHSFQDRIKTLQAAKSADLEICCGVIVGMGETADDVIDMALTLNNFGIASIPVNFLIPIEGNIIKKSVGLTPEYCLRVLCLFRLLNPQSEIRVAAGREYHLREMEVMALYPANSLFMDGYLNTKGSSRNKTLQMIKDAGFTIESDKKLEELLRAEEISSEISDNFDMMKEFKDLRSQLKS